MRGLTMIQGLLLGSLCFSILGCAGRTPAPQDPSSTDPIDETQSPSETASSESMSESQSLDVGMEFKDKGDDANPRANREAPPTGSWKPVEKTKVADPKKISATASR